MSRFDQVDIAALRRRRTVKWSLYGPDVLAAWVAEMDFDVAPPIRAALLGGDRPRGLRIRRGRHDAS